MRQEIIIRLKYKCLPGFILATIVGLSSAPALGVINCSTEPQYIKKRSATCDDAKEMKRCGLTKACEQYSTSIDEALSKFREEMSQFCSTVKANSANACIGGAKQNCSQIDTSKLTAEASLQLQALKRDLQKNADEVEKAGKVLAAEAGDAKSCDQNATPEEEGKVMQAGTQNIPVREQLVSAQIVQEQGNLANDLITSKKEFQQEIKRLDSHAAALSGESTLTKDNGNNLDSKTPAAQADNNTSTPPSSPSSPSSSSSGSGSGDSAAAATPSNLSNSSATSPTPDATNPNASSDNSNKTDNAQNSASTTKTSGGVDTGNLNKINSTDPAAIASIGANPGAGSTAASDSSSASSATPNLRARLSKAINGSSGGSSASPAGGGGTLDAKGDLAKAKESTGSYGASDNSAGGGGGGGGGSSDDDVLSPFGKPLDEPKFSLAGSETDASVKGLMGAFNGDNSSQVSRDPASELSDGIGEKNSVTLFERTRSCHERCIKKGCVSGLLKRKVNGS